MEAEPIALLEYDGDLSAVLEFLKRTRNELRVLRWVRVWRDQVRIVDINGDFFEVRGIGFPHADVESVLDAVKANYNPSKIHDETQAEYKQFKTGRQRPWAADRVM